MLAGAALGARELAGRGRPVAAGALAPPRAPAARVAARDPGRLPVAGSPVGALEDRARGPAAAGAREAPPQRASEAELARWIADLAHDDVRWNANRAYDRLAAAGERARPALEAALHSLDHQQRQLAAHLLRWLGGEPSRQLLLVSLEGLRHDRLPTDPAVGHGFANLANARQGARFLVAHAARVRPELLRGLQARDGQYRLLCAYVLAASGTTRGIERTTQVLIEHLHDNDVRGDAVLAASALYRLGEPGLPFVRHAMGGADEQALALLKLVELDVRSPPESEAGLRRRRGMHEVTRTFHDPAYECSVTTGGLVQWGSNLSRDVGRGPRTGVVR